LSFASFESSFVSAAAGCAIGKTTSMPLLVRARQAYIPSLAVSFCRKSSSKSSSSSRWLARQRNDAYVHKRSSDGSAYVSRSAFKLVELDKTHHFLRPDARVIDLGAAPGGWTQVASASRPSKIIAVDLLDLSPSVSALPAVYFLKGDFREQSVQEKVREALHGQQADVVLSDMVCNFLPS
jgi:23S rRNA (uridine2552-2'-O)-methyltransferase